MRATADTRFSPVSNSTHYGSILLGYVAFRCVSRAASPILVLVCCWREGLALNRMDTRYLIVGGGIIGCSIAYHLAKNGEKDVVLLEKASLTEGATWHAAGLVGQLRSSRNTTRMLKRSVAMYDSLEAETGAAFDWKKVGSLRLAATNERLLEAKRLATMARSFDLEMRIITAEEAKDLFPYIDASGLLGAAYIPSDGHVDPASLTQAIASAARNHGARIKQGVKVEDFELSDGRITKVKTSDGDYTADVVVLAAGMWSRELGAKLGIRVPACAVEHQYIVTEPLPDVDLVKRFCRHYETRNGLVYYKPDAGGRLVIGGYEEGDSCPSTTLASPASSCASCCLTIWSGSGRWPNWRPR